MVAEPGFSSFELSKRLHELSGWEGDVEWSDWLPISEKNYPAYTCGYLTRMLYWAVAEFTLRMWKETSNPGNIRYEAWTPGPTTHYVSQYEMRRNTGEYVQVIEKTPEDALAQLCIFLFEEGRFPTKLREIYFDPIARAPGSAAFEAAEGETVYSIELPPYIPNGHFDPNYFKPKDFYRTAHLGTISPELREILEEWADDEGGELEPEE